jgi:hypothetical protein
MNPMAIELQARTRRFATAVIKFCERLGQDAATQKIVGQLLDSAGSTTAILVASRKTAQRHKAERERLEKQLREATRRRLST